jgi:hypothetical protein
VADLCKEVSHFSRDFCRGIRHFDPVPSNFDYDDWPENQRPYTLDSELKQALIEKDKTRLKELIEYRVSYLTVRDNDEEFEIAYFKDQLVDPSNIIAIYTGGISTKISDGSIASVFGLTNCERMHMGILVWDLPGMGRSGGSLTERHVLASLRALVEMVLQDNPGARIHMSVTQVFNFSD